MIKRTLAGLIATIVATLAFGTVSAPPAAAVQDPNHKCVWIWTAGTGYCKKME
jgi:hypothetical protein